MRTMILIALVLIVALTACAEGGAFSGLSAGTPEGQAALQLDQAAEHLEQASAEADSGNYGGVDQALEAYNAAFDQAMALIMSGQVDGATGQQIADEALAEQDALMDDLLGEEAAACVDQDGDGQDDYLGSPCDDPNAPIGVAACTDADGNGFDDVYLELPCASGVAACVDADQNGYHDTYFSLPCDLSAAPDNLEDGAENADNDNDNLDVTPTGTPGDNDNLDVTAPATGEPADAACVGAEPHPVGMALAEDYDADYATIMGYFCGAQTGERYGFGEINLAYGIAERLGVEAAEIFALREQGLGWGQIMQAYDLVGKGRDRDDDRPGQGRGRGNGNGNGNGNGGGNGNGNGNGGKP